MLTILAFGLALAISASENDPEHESPPDYSPDALSLIFRDEDPDDEGDDHFLDKPIEKQWEHWSLRFIPLMAPLRFNEGLSGPTMSQIVDPFTMLGVEFPPAGAAGDEWAPEDLTWAQRRYRWKMIRFVNAENRRDNAIPSGD